MKNFPVFVFPVSLEFYLNARHTHKQLLTVYNPYDFSVNFKVLCTSPNKFTVIDPEGVIAPQSCIDIVVRYTQPSASHCNTIEKFRITMYDKNTQQALGKRDIPTKLIEGEPSNTNPESLGDSFHPLVTKATPIRPAEEHSRITCSHPSHIREQQPVNVIAVAVSICCITALLLPTQPEQVVKSQWPDWLHIGSNLKLVFSFVLGLLWTITTPDNSRKPNEDLQTVLMEVTKPFFETYLKQNVHIPGDDMHHYLTLLLRTRPLPQL